MIYSTLKRVTSIISVLLIGIFFTGTMHTSETTQTDLKSTITESNDPDTVVEMTNTMKFTPDTVRIKKGETVQWKNTSLLAHSVTADPSLASNKNSVQLPKGADAFDSGMLEPDQTFTHTFKTTGTYQYFCIPHEGAKMFGWIIVSGK